MKRKIKRILIGLDAVGERAVGSQETESSIRYARKFECALVSDQGEAITWDGLDNPEEPLTILQYVVRDRKLRIDQGKIMADRPPFAVVTIRDQRVVRLEFYEGHDALECTYDLRAPELQGVKLPRYLERDPQAYDPVEYLKSAGLVPPGTEEIIREMLREIHKKKQ